MSDFYDWQKTITYDADVTMVVGARGLGKTYGLRKQFVRDYINHKWRFVEVTRTKTELQAVMHDYFAKVGLEFPQYVFKYEKARVYIADKPADDAKPTWDVIGYFVAMTQEQQTKKMSSAFVDVRRIVLDEAILDRHDRYHKYLSREWSKLSGIVDSVSRERPDDPHRLKPRVYLLGNALDLTNPYFEAFGIDDYNLQFGYSWHRNKTCLLHYVKDAAYAREKTNDTVAGRMLADDNLESALNEFVTLRGDFVVSRKPKGAKYMFGIVCDSKEYGVYECMNEGYYWIDRKLAAGDHVTFAITTGDAKINRLQARKVEKPLMMLGDLHYSNLLRYQSSATQSNFVDVLTRFGVRF